jgi:hypothetical protein
MAEESAPLAQQITVEDSESWADHPVKIVLKTPTTTGSTSQAFRVTDEEAFELLTKVAQHLLVRSRRAASPWQVGARVSWNDAIDTNVVYGHITEHDEAEQKTQVKWADGSGPTWHLTRKLRLLDVP